MGKRGPPPKPTKLKLLEGTFRPDRAPEVEPQPKEGIPVMPAWIKRDRVARGQWEIVVPELERLGLLAVVDGAALEGYCANYCRAVKAEREVLKYGVTLDSPFGRKRNPACSIAKDSWVEVRNFGNLYGLNPSARTRISVTAKPPKDDTEDFLFGNRRGA